jgi:uncharacterized membrane protein
MTPLPPDVERYLKELRLALSPLGTEERDEIAAELRTHFEERIAQGRGELLSDFPSAESYAAAFVAERSLVSALVEGTPWAVSRSLWVGRVARAFSLAAAVPLGLVQLCAITLVILGALKPIFSDRIGLWLGPRGTGAIGYLGDPQAHELLGWWGVPLFIGGGALLFVLAHRAQVALARRRLLRVRAAGARS